MLNSSPVVHSLLVDFGVVLLLFATVVKESQLLVLGLRLDFDNNHLLQKDLSCRLAKTLGLYHCLKRAGIGQE